MAGSSEIEQVKQASDIIEEIGARITLQRVGANFRSLCPFHSEKSPSFYVNETMQRYKCFGCNETGDIFNFLEKYDGMTFGESLRYLADKAGITLTQKSIDRNDEERVSLISILDLAKDYYQYLLTTHPAGQKAREYLQARGTTADSRKIFTLGYALPEWDGLSSYLLKKKRLRPELVEQTGLIIKGRNGWYDRFRNRIMFPLRDSRGVIVGFSGRILQSEPTKAQITSIRKTTSSTDPDLTSIQHSEIKEAKYINTPETMLYHKGKLLYGYAEHWQAIREKREIVLVEGEFDVISSSQAHVSHVAGLKGSALTSDHVRLLSRTVDRIILSLDSDSAGVEATKRAITTLQDTPLSRTTPLDLRVSVVSDGKDPDDLSRKDPKLWRKVVKQSVPAYEFIITTACVQHDVTSAVGKQQVLYEIAPILNKITHQVEREHYLQLVAELLHVGKASVASDILSLGSRKMGHTHAKPVADSKSTQVEDSPTEKLEKYALFLWTKMDDSDFYQAIDEVVNWHWELPSASAIAKVIPEKRPENLKELVAVLPDDLQQALFEMHTNPYYESHLVRANIMSEWQSTMNKLQRVFAKNQAKLIGAQLALLDNKIELSEAEKQQQSVLLQELAQLMSKQQI